MAAEIDLGPDRPGGNHDTVEHLGTVKHLDTAALQAGLGHVRESPPDHGTVEMIVRRPAADEREVLAAGTLDADVGLAVVNQALCHQITCLPVDDIDPTGPGEGDNGDHG